MKHEQFILVNDNVLNNAIMRIKEIPCDGKTKIVIANAGTKSDKQRGLQWKWYTEVSEAGIGGKHEDTKDGVHLICKYHWAIPILIRDDMTFGELHHIWKQLYGTDAERMQWFTENQVSTEAFSTSQMAEYLTDFQKHYGPLVNLTDPAQMGVIF